MSWNRVLRRLAIGMLAALPFEAGCGGDAAPAAGTGGAGIPGVRGPAATPKGKLGGPARPRAGARAGARAGSKA